MRFLYHFFLTLTLCGFAVIAFALKGISNRVGSEDSAQLASWAWIFSITCALFTFLFATLYENRTGRNRRG